MRSLVALLASVAIIPALLADSPKDQSPIQWKKIVVDKVFRSEGVAVADVNKDGKLDILVGDFWYEAPDWKRHAIRRADDFRPGTHENGYYGDGLKGYSECMCCWAEDVNGDGWPDEIVIGYPGKPAYWYENPKGKPGPWKEHVIWHSACNETPQFVDLFGTGKRVLVMGWQPITGFVRTEHVDDPFTSTATSPSQQNPPGRIVTKIEQPIFTIQTAGNQGQMAWFAPSKDPTQLWEMHPISEPSKPGKEIPGTQRFSHGLGIGDVNGDGRKDVICTGGWWEQPAEGMKAGPWKFHPADLSSPCADMFAYDMDGDGKADVISSCAHQFGIWWYQQRPGSNGSPSFIKHDLFPKLVSETHAMHFVDIDGDGLKDLVTGKRHWSHGKNEPGSEGPAMLYWFKARKSADGMTSFTPIVIDDDSGIGTQFEVIDMNGDGKPDIVTSSKKGVYVHLQK
jgi:hypothetical protein